MNARLAKILAVATVWTLCLAMQLAGGFVVSKAQAQTSPAATSAEADKLTVDADEIVYDTDKKTIAARGNAKLYYKGKILEADQVIYRSDSERVFAEGHVVLTEPDGQVVRANSLELTDQFHDGFIKSMRVDTVDNTHFVAPRAERISGRQTIFERGTYTACDACKEDPTKPPLWQVKARRIIHNQVEKVIYYEDATLDLAGVPVAYFPYVSAPDNTYTINGAIISQNDQGAFLSSPNGAGDQRVRGYIETIGAFPINSRWKWGWDLAYVSDKWFYQNYKIDSPSVTQLGTIKRESTSTAFLHGEDKNSLFDARTYYFQTLLTEDNQNIQPLILPVIDYDRRYHLGGAIGGEVALNANFTNLSRLEADFGTLSGSCSSPTTTNCFMRGIGGDYSRYTTEIGWRRSFIDPLGQSWTPFASMRGDAAYATLFRNGTANAAQDNFLSTGNQGLTRAMGTIGMTYRFPFVAASSFGSHIFEPIVQVISRPNESNIGNLPNEDSQSLVFDDTNLFSVDKYTGYDRVEGGTRANYGAQYSLGMINGAHANILIGQSVQMAGLNSFAQRGLALEGTDSGLDKTTSDYVSRLQFVPNANYSFTARGRFDPDGLNSKRFELENRASFGDLSTNLIYANYAAQPNVGITNRREGLGVGAGYRLTPNWSVAGNTLFALTRYLSDPDLPRAYIAAYSASATYHDECTDLSIAYIGREPYATGTTTQDQTIFVRLTLRSLGTIETKREMGSLAGQQ